jgi:hypothetical protein
MEGVSNLQRIRCLRARRQTNGGGAVQYPPKNKPQSGGCRCRSLASGRSVLVGVRAGAVVVCSFLANGWLPLPVVLDRFGEVRRTPASEGRGSFK